MKKTPSNATKWFYWFSLGVALLIAHALFSNVANIYLPIDDSELVT